MSDIYECNGDRSHIAIQYGSQPCPLCSCHDKIKEAEETIRALVNACDRLMGDSDLIDGDDSIEMQAMQMAALFLEKEND